MNNTIEPSVEPLNSFRPKLLALSLGLLAALLILALLFWSRWPGRVAPLEPVPGVARLVGFSPADSLLVFDPDDQRMMFNGKQLEAGSQTIFIARLPQNSEEGLQLPSQGSHIPLVYFPTRGLLASFSNDTQAYGSEGNPGTVIAEFTDRRGRPLAIEPADPSLNVLDTSFVLVAETGPSENSKAEQPSPEPVPAQEPTATIKR
ncbi:hypothetical protein KQ313_10325 [Synechococcus sp. CS-1325]|uniref:hypothetical protein n=1 Tax=unclassified Synechococcus TaxID=2626047 RepID=UPI000DAF9A78|nr:MULTISPECIES: hypothetical protein [unclassified Synechococcus]MCT0200074.1 hypothetical protein [Synechococcus sp. CS-1325]MCT0212614.1 hypothetical protein [Synechococcus sp. CS-1326]MCT0233623.1 hypothetical protein [Synechococcus sp. CS-1327]PZV00642.1 MAG: hypothetical protein DCF24_06530 [Cyanobium sp.]